MSGLQTKINEISTRALPYTQRLGDVEIITGSHDIYPPGEMAKEFRKTVLHPLGDLHGKTALDMGTGSGVTAIFLAKQGAHVLAADILSASMAATRLNADHNGVSELVKTRQTDGFENIDVNEKFDLINASLPQDDATPTTGLEHSFYDPGHALLKSFAAHARHHLKPDGQILIGYMDHNQTAMPIDTLFPNAHIKTLTRLGKDVSVFRITY